jgi:hypothetical protein
MRRVFLALALTCALLGIAASVVTAAPPKAQALNCFVGGGGTCTVSDNNTATLDVPGGGYAGVYVNGKSYSGKPLAAVDFSFQYWGDVSGGSPRLSIPIDDGSGTLKYAFIDAAGCGYVTDVAPNTMHEVGTNVSQCKVTYDGTTYANWDAFADAHRDYRIATGTYAFVVADQPGHVVIYSHTTK